MLLLAVLVLCSLFASNCVHYLIQFNYIHVHVQGLQHITCSMRCLLIYSFHLWVHVRESCSILTPAVYHRKYAKPFCAIFCGFDLLVCVLEPLSRDLLRYIFMQINPAPTKTIKQTTVEDNGLRECVGMQGRRVQGVHGVRNAMVEEHAGKMMLGGWWGMDCKGTQESARACKAGGCKKCKGWGVQGHRGIRGLRDGRGVGYRGQGMQGCSAIHSRRMVQGRVMQTENS